MDRTIVLAVNSGEGKTRLLTANANKAVKVKLIQSNKYLLKNLGNDFAPENITLTRVGNELHVIQEGDTQASIIIEDYFNGKDHNPILLGMAEDGQLYAYVPLSGEGYENGYLTGKGEMTEAALGGPALGSGNGIFVTSDDDNHALYGLLGWVAAATAIGAGVAIANHNKNNGGNSDTTPPAKPAIGEALDNTGSITGPIKNGSFTDETKPVLSGTGEPGNTITIYDNGQQIGNVIVDGNGNWSFTPETPLVDGQHELVITETDQSGNISAPSDSLNFGVDTVAPDLPGIQHIMDKVGDTVGEIKPGSSTDDTRPEMSGTGEAGSIVTIYDNGVAIGNAEVNSAGRWSFQPENALAEGAHNITISQTDAAGNQSGVSEGWGFTVDTTAPSQPKIDEILDNTGSITGPLHPGDSTDETRPELGGKGEPGNVIIIEDNGKEIGNTIVDENGNWTFKPDTPLEEGRHDLVIVEKDKAGNKSDPSAPIEIIVDTTAPNQPGVADAHDNTGPITGPILNGSSTDETHPELTGVGEAGNTVNIYDNGEKIGSVVVGEDGKWSFTPEDALGENDHSITVTETDPAGNESKPSESLDFTVDITPPLSGPDHLAITGVEDNVGDKQGNVASGEITDDSKPLISGIGTAGDTVFVYTTDAAGKHLIGSALVDADGIWSMTPELPLLEGNNQLAIVAQDPAGNRTDLSSPSYDINLFIPIATGEPAIISVVDNVEPHTGPLQKGEATNDNTPTLNGTAAAGNIVTIYDNGQAIGSTTADESGRWSFTPETALVDGSHNLLVTATDAAGNISAPSGNFAISIDTTVPDAATDIVITDDVGSKTGPVAPGDTTDDRSPTLSGKAEPGSTVNVIDNGKDIGSTVVDENGNWTFTPDAPLDNGEHTLNTTVTDPAGNTSEPSPGVTIVIDDTPVLVSIGEVKDDVGPITGNISQGGVTDDTRPEITGSGKPGSVVTVQDGDTVLGTTTVQPDGSWSFTPETDLGEGEHQITVTAEDAAGNRVTSPSVDFTVDSVAPNKPSIGSALDDVGEIRGELASGSVTDDANPTFKGTAEPGSTINVYDNGELIGSVMTDNNGAWAFTPTTPLAEGEHSLTTTATDKAGNTSEPSDAFELTTDYTPSLTGPEYLAITGVEDNVGSIQGNIASGGLTDDSLPRISGIGTAGDTILVYAKDSAGNHVIGSATVEADGTWSMTPELPLLEGSNQLTIVAVDAAGNKTAPSAPSYDLTVDITVPGLPAITSVVDNVEPHTGALQKGDVTNDNTPTLNGTAEANSTVTVYDNGQVIGSVVADANGKWTLTPDTALQDGNHSLNITATDAAGNTSAPSGNFAIVIDTTVPDAATDIVITDDVGSKTGPVAPGDTTDDRSPTLSGKAEPGSTVNVIDNGKDIGSTVVDENGNWTFTPDAPLDNGEHTLNTTVTDPAGNTSEPSPGVTIVIDDTPVLVSIGEVKDDVGPITGNISQGGVTDDTRPEITGSGKPGSVVTVQDGDTVLGTTTVQPDGSWSFTPETDLGEGEHHLTVTAEDAAGNRVTSPSVDFTVDSVAPNKPSIGSALDDVGEIRGELASGSVTDDANPTFKGTAEPGSTINVYDNGELIGSVMTDNNGAWAFTPTTPLAEGEHSLTTTATDKAGNTSEPSDAFELTLDFTAPDASLVAITGVDDQVGAQKGNVAAGGTTDDSRPTISGTGAEAGNTITVYNGSNVIGTATVQADGTWSLKPTLPLADGLYTLTAKETDAVGNTTVASPEYAFNVVTVAPNPPVITSVEDNVEPYTGALQKGDVTNDSTPTLKGSALPGGTVTVFDNGVKLGSTVADSNGAWTFTPESALQDGNHSLTASVTDSIGQTSPTTGGFGIVIDTAAPAPATGLTVIDDVGAEQGALKSGDTTDDNTPTFSGKAEGGSTVTILDNGKVIGSVVADDNGDWSYTPGAALENGAHDFTTTVTDPAGNTSAEGEHLQVTIDVIPGQVALGSLVDDVGTITGNIAQNGVTDDARPTLNGTAKGGSTVTVKDGDTVLGTTTAKADGSWSFTPTADLGEGAHSLSATAVDLAGNSSDSSNWAFTVDTVKPVAPTIDSAADDVGSVQLQDMVSGSATDDPTPTLSGRAEANSTVTVSDQNGVLGTAKTDASGHWTFTPSSKLSEGEHNFTVTATDAAGNVSDKSNTFVLTLDFTAPDASLVAITGVDDQVGAQKGNVAAGGTTDDSRPTISGTGAEAGNTITVYNGSNVIGTATVQADGTWSLKPTLPLADGLYTLTAKETDAVGNTTVASPEYAFNVVTVAPNPPVITSVEDNVEPHTGALQKGDVTNDSTPTLKGSALPGGTVTVFDNGVKLGSTVADSNGLWTFTPDTALQDGNHSLTASVTDSIGQTSPTTGGFGIVIDTAAPAPATGLTVIDDVGAEQGALKSGDTTDDNTPTFSGKAEGGSTVTILDNGKVIGSVVADDNGDWSYTPGAALENGAHDFTTTVTDPAGNVSAEGEHLQVTIDVIPGQVALGSLVDDVGTITGNIAQNGVTDDARPTLNGTAKGGSTVTVKDGDTVLGTTTAKADGSWSFTPESDLGEGAHSLSATAVDLAGNSSDSSNWAFTVDTVKPVAPTIDSAADDVGSVQLQDMVSGSATDDPTPTLSGRAEANSTVTVSDQNGVLGTAKTDASGHWTFTPSSKLSEGEHNFTVTATDAAGNVSDKSNIFVLTLDFTAPDASKVAITDVIDNVGSVTGSVAQNGVLDDRHPVIKGTGAEVGDIITVSTTDTNGNTIVLGTTTVAADGTWALTPTGALYDGLNKLTVTEADSAGNVAKPDTSYSVNMSLTPGVPSIASIVDDTEANNVNLGQGALTKDNTPTLSGKSEVAEGNTITIYNGAAKVGTTTAGPNGDWSFTPTSKLVDGSYSFTVTATNSAGQESDHSQAHGITIDTTVSDAAITITAISDDLGISDSDFITSDTTLLIHGSLDKPLLADEWVEVSLDGGNTWTRAQSHVGTDWTVDLQSTPLKAGNYTIEARVVDQAGNIGNADNHALTINTDGPNMNGLTTTTGITTDTSHGLVTGDLFSHSATATNNDMVTRDSTVTLNGKLSAALQADQYLQISLDNGNSWVTLLSQSGTDWRFTLDAVNTSTTVSYQLRVIDSTGNPGINTNFADSYQVVIDLDAPDSINIAPNVPQSVVNTATYVFDSSQYGKVEAGAIVSLVSDVNRNGTYQEGLDQILGFAKANADGSWSLSTTLPAGAHNIAFMVWDEAGNRSSVSPSTSIGVTDGPGSTLIEQSWGGTTTGDTYGLNAAAVTISGTGTWSFAQSVRGTTGSNAANALRVYTGENREDYTSTYLAEPSTANGAGYNVNNTGYGHFVNSMVFADINRDGLTDVMSQVSSYGNGGRTAYWMQNADGSYAPKALNQGDLNHLGGAIAYDKEGDGFLDFVLADSASDSISFIKNQNGTLTYEQAKGFSAGHPGGAIPSNLSLLHEVGAVDIDNNGTVDITAHIDYNGTTFAGDSSRGLGIIYNQTTGTASTDFGEVGYYANVFRGDGTTDYGNLSISMTYADFNGDGWLDLFLSRGSKNGQNSDESRIYLNDGTGKLMATDQQALWFGDSMDGGTSLAVDWNHDGKMDIIEVPRGASGLAAQTGSPTLYVNTGNNTWNSNATALTDQKFSDITGAVALDYDWDGSMDLVMYRSGKPADVVAGDAAAPTLLVKNTNVAADGTSLQIRILDGNGINTFYSNTVKLYDSQGNLVSTQLINPQASGSSNSMGLVSFFGLDPNEVYSVQLLRITNGVANHVGAFAGEQGGNINTTVNENWGGLTTGKAHDAYVLTAENTGDSNNTIGDNGIVGTGYNDTFFSSAGDDTYSGGGGWNQVVNGQAVWSESEGMDIVDYSGAPNAVTADLWKGTATGHGNDKLISIEGVIGTDQDDIFTDNSANNLFEGRGGNDTFYLMNSGNDTLMYKVLAGLEHDANGGNGHDTVHGFHVGNVASDIDADLIDLSDLLDYNGPISFFQDDGKMELDNASKGIHDYLKVETVGNDTVISIDRDGQGNQYSSSSVITLADVHTDLLTLLQNNQIIV